MKKQIARPIFTAIEQGEAAATSRNLHDAVCPLCEHLLLAHDDERRHVAAALHNKFGQNLLALRIDVSMLHARTFKKHPRLNRKAAEILTYIDTTLASAREIINTLHPTAIALGLLPSIEWKLGEFSKNGKVACRLQVDGNDSDFEPYDNRSLPLTRILQASLDNVTRHARASQVDVRLSALSRQLIMEIEDDGIGIHPEQINKPGCFGLRLIQQRTNILNGGLTIGNGAQGLGARLTISIPEF